MNRFKWTSGFETTIGQMLTNSISTENISAGNYYESNC